jgi:hypothetical protein
MVDVNRTAANPSVSSPRRFILLPEETAEQRHGPRVRRYRLTSVGQGVGLRRGEISSVDVATARIARELGRLGRM